MMQESEEQHQEDEQQVEMDEEVLNLMQAANNGELSEQ